MRFWTSASDGNRSARAWCRWARPDIRLPWRVKGENLCRTFGRAPSAELTLQNITPCPVSGVARPPSRALGVGRAHACERLWRNLLKPDSAVAWFTSTILAAAGQQDATPILKLSLIAFPRAELFQETAWLLRLGCSTATGSGGVAAAGLFPAHRLLRP